MIQCVYMSKPKFTPQSGHLTKPIFPDAETAAPPAVQEIDALPTGVEASAVWDERTAEQREEHILAAETMAAMAICADRGITPADFRVIKFGEADNPTYATMYAGTERMVLGDPNKPYDSARSWNSITPDKNDRNYQEHPEMMVVIEGNEIDVRDAQTLSALAAVSKENPKIDEWVLLTGEPELASSFRAPAVYLIDGQADVDILPRVNVYDHLGFRPAVVSKK
jgi:hypothetical protein